MRWPSRIPIFALPNVVLFPGIPLPLHIFEPRYRDMVRDAMEGEKLIGMALLRGDWQRRYEERPDVFDICCAGKLANVESLPDGKFNILLQGLRECTIREHIFDHSYREADVVWRPGLATSLEPELRRQLVDQLSDYLSQRPTFPAQGLLREASLSDTMLVNFFSYALEIDPLEKQGLLQANSLAERAMRLTQLLEFHREEARINVPQPSSDRCH